MKRALEPWFIAIVILVLAVAAAMLGACAAPRTAPPKIEPQKEWPQEFRDAFERGCRRSFARQVSEDPVLAAWFCSCFRTGMEERQPWSEMEPRLGRPVDKDLEGIAIEEQLECMEKYALRGTEL